MWRPTPFTLLVLSLVFLFSAAVIMTTVDFISDATALQNSQAEFFRSAKEKIEQPIQHERLSPVRSRMATADEVMARKLAINTAKHTLAKLNSLVDGNTACDKIQTGLGTFTQCDNGAVGVNINSRSFSGANDFLSRSDAVNVPQLNGQPVKKVARCYKHGYLTCKKPCAWNSNRRMCVVPTPAPLTVAPVFHMKSVQNVNIRITKHGANLTQQQFANILTNDLPPAPTTPPTVNVSAQWEKSYSLNVSIVNPTPVKASEASTVSLLLRLVGIVS
jgi:DNA-binding transcriptional regulator YiaG